jgi:hypothetical protein
MKVIKGKLYKANNLVLVQKYYKGILLHKTKDYIE